MIAFLLIFLAFVLAKFTNINDLKADFTEVSEMKADLKAVSELKSELMDLNEEVKAKHKELEEQKAN